MAMFDAIEIGDIAEEEAKKLGVPPKLFRDVVLKGEWHGKDQFDVSEVSPKGAKGPAQVIDATWKGLIKNGAVSPDADINDVRTNLRAGAVVLKEQLAAAKGNPAGGVAGYNGGSVQREAVMRGELPPAKETQDYLIRLGLIGKEGNNPSAYVASSDPATPTGLVLARQTTKGGTPEQRSAMSAELEQQIEANRASTLEFQKALFGGATALKTAGTAAINYGNSAADATVIQGQIDVAQLIKKQVINDTLEASINSPDSVIVAAQKKRKEAQIKMDALRPVIDEEDKVALWDDPLRWIANQFTLPTLKREFNQAHREEAAMVKRMATTQQLASAQHAIDPASVAEDMGRKAATAATAIKFKALEDASKMQAQGSEYLARAIQADMVVNDRSWDQRMQLARQYQDSLSYRRATEVDAKATAADKKLAGVVDVISTKLNAIGMPSIDVPTLKTLGQQRAGELIDWAQLPTLGNGPGESMAAIRKFGSTAAVAEKDPTLFRFVNQLVQSPDYKAISAEKQNNAKFQNLTSEEQREQVVQEVFNKQQIDLSKLKGDNSKLDATNPYKLVHLNTVANPELKDNVFARDVGLIAATSSDKKTVSDKDMMLSFLGKVQAEPGKVKEYAAQLTEYYSKATKAQWSKSGMAITGYPKFQSYGIGDPFGNAVVNTLNPIEVESWATRRLAAKLAETRVPVNNTIWGYMEQADTDMAFPFGKDPLGINK